MKDKRNVLILTICSIILLSVVLFISYAYFTGSADINGNISVNTNVDDHYKLTFISKDTNSIALNITSQDMLTGTAGSVAKNNTALMNISLSSDDGASYVCTYDIVWKWDETNNSNNQYTKTLNATNEYTVSGSDGLHMFRETQVNDYGNDTLLYSGEITSSSATPTVQSWSYDVTFYNLDLNQNEHASSSYLSKIKVENVECIPGHSFSETILANNSESIASHGLTAPDFSVQATTNEGMYLTEDDYTSVTNRESYYFRGAVDNNWVSFAGFYWRIIRINGDGSIRMIYSGTTAPTETTSVVMTGDNTQIGTGQYNIGANTAELVGYRYTINSGHGLDNSSNIKGEDTNPAVGSLDNWYQTNIANNGIYSSRVSVNQTLCNDRVSYSDLDMSSTTLSVGTNQQFFNAMVRDLHNNPILTCENTNDLFTTSNNEIGNKSLIYPIGLITADEVKMAGISLLNNTASYLYTNRDYWTASPTIYDTKAINYCVTDAGGLSSGDVNVTFGIRPIISLNSNVPVTGLGTWNSPYVVS